MKSHVAPSTRKFSMERLYKLICSFVITSTILLALFCLIEINNWNYWNDDFSKCATNPLNHDASTPQILNTDLVDDCEKSALQSINASYNAYTTAGEYAILLPLVFFGARGIYKYTFPKSHPAPLPETP